MAFRIVVDPDLCQSHGVCEGEAPELFEVPKHSQVVVLDANPPDSLRAQAEAAVKYCPTHALSIIEGADLNTEPNTGPNTEGD